MNKRIFTVITFCITLAALYVSFKDTDIGVIGRYMREGNYLYVIPAFIGLMLYAYLRAVRWGYFFDVKLSARLLFSTTMIGLMANNIFPARAGEILKAYILGKHSGVSKSACLATVVLERLWDGITLVAFIGGMFVWVLCNGSSVLGSNSDIGLIRYAAYISIAVYVVIAAVIIAWKCAAARTISCIGSVVSRFSPKLAAYVTNRLAAFSGGLSIFNNPRNLLIVSAYSVLIWFSAVVTLFLMFKVFSFDVPFGAAFMLVILIALFVMIPSVGSLGTMQLAFVLGLAMYGIDKSRALSFSILYQFFDTVPMILIGLFYFFKDGITFKQVSAIKEEMK